MRVLGVLRTCGLAAALTLAAASAALADPAIWRVAGPHASVFIVGSTIDAPADGRWKTPALHDAAASAREVWFTTPFGLPGPFVLVRMAATLATRGSFPNGQTLSSLLAPDDRARLARLASRYHLDMGKLDRMQPWHAHVTLGLAVRKANGDSSGSPVERYILSVAQGAPRKAMDTYDEDLKLLVATPQDEEVISLEDAMRHYDDPTFDRRYGEAWAAGDLGWIEREREQWLQKNTPVTYRTMQIQPRERWADQVARLANGSKTVILVLDAANTVGQNGLPAMLRRKGLRVDGP